MITYRAATDDELGACIALQHRVFRPNEPHAPERYRSYVREDPTYAPGQTRIAVIDGQIVGHLRVWDRTLLVRGVGITAGGIGSLLTHPDYQGRGIAFGLLKDTEEYFKEAEYDIGLLFSIIGTPYYERRGWTPIPVSTFQIDRGSGRTRNVSCRSLCLEHDLSAVRELHRSVSQDYTATEIRDKEYWSTGPARYRSVFPKVGLGDPLEGYVNWEVVEGEVRVVECCAKSSTAYTELASFVVNEANEHPGKAIRGSLPLGHSLATQLERLTGNQTAWSAHDEMMVKIARWDLLRGKLLEVVPELPDEFPRESEANDFWAALLGSESDSPWSQRLGDCPPNFYWWPDIF